MVNGLSVAFSLGITVLNVSLEIQDFSSNKKIFGLAFRILSVSFAPSHGL